MRKTRKQLLGLAGLAVVGIMTAVAYAMPAPGAAAAEDEPATDDAGVNVQVEIKEGKARIQFLAPLDGQELVNPGQGSIQYEEVNQIDVEMICTNEAGVSQTVTLPSYTPTSPSGVYNFNYPVDDYGSCTLSAKAYGNNGAIREDAVTFTYSASSTVVNPTPGENGDPSIDVEVNDDVEYVEVQAYDKNGNPIFVDKDGNPTPIKVPSTAVDPETGKITIDLPFEEYGVEPGDYTIITIAKDKDGHTISMNTSSVKYAPNTPDLPNLGAVSGNEFNITRLDFILTGLIAFAMVASLAVVLVFRNSRR